MKYLTIGAVILLAVCGVEYWTHPHLRREMVFGALFTVFMYLMGAVGRYCEWRELRKVEKQVSQAYMDERARRWRDANIPKLLGALTASWLATLKAKALIMFAVVALGLGLIAWGVIEFIYDRLTMVPRIQRNDVARVTVTRPLVAAARPVRLITATPLEIHESIPGAPWAYRKASRTDLRVEWSQDLKEWKPWPSAGNVQHGFWRMRE